VTLCSGLRVAAGSLGLLSLRFAKAWTPAFAGVTLCHGLWVAAESLGLLPYQVPVWIEPGALAIREGLDPGFRRGDVVPRFEG